MNLPDIGETVTTAKALYLCRHFRLAYLVRRIQSTPNRYKAWKFDGCSGLPDKWLGFFTGCKWEDVTYKCCLPHDLCYGYGDKGNTNERRQVDMQFYKDLVNKAGMNQWLASAFLRAVRVGGEEEFGMSFS